MNQLLSLAKRVVPARWRPSSLLNREVVRRTRRTVHGGPFAGLRYVSEGVCGCYMPKLLGTYERELHPSVVRVASGRFDGVVNVGAAEGYYSVGLLRAMPDVQGIAFEMSSRARELIASLADLNGVRERLEIRGRCDPPDLDDALRRFQRPIVLCDVEGYESVLLDLEAVPSLANAAMLVEVHDHLSPGISELLRDRFRDSHRIEVIHQQPRTPAEYPFRAIWTRAFPWLLTRYVLNEFRSSQITWMWLAPKQNEELREWNAP